MGEKIGQIVDSAGNLPRDIIEKYQIREVPFYYTFDGETYLKESVQRGEADFFHIMQEHPEQVPRTAAPNIHDWLQAYDEAYIKGCRKIIVSTISHKLSSSFENAHLARKMFLSEVRDVEIKIITSSSCACGQAALEIKIAQLIQDRQLSWEELLLKIQRMITQLTTLFTVDSLFYMKAGGRIGGATAFLGKVLNIKPVCEFADGEVRPIKAIRGRKKSIIAMTEYVISRIKEGSNPLICTQNALCKDEEIFMIDYLCSALNYHSPIHSGTLGVVVGAHSGPGSLGIGFVLE
jgi:DegV family protein with EDD domain